MRKLVLLLVAGGLMALLAAIMVMVVTDTSPTQADHQGKTLICHYNDGLNPKGKQVHAGFWSVDNVSDHSLDSHLGTPHAHHADTDLLVPSPISPGACEAREGHDKGDEQPHA